MKKREILEFDEELIDGGLEEWLPEEYEIIEETQVGFDGEKGFCDYEVIIKRKFDGKFFKGFRTDFGMGNEEIDTEWKEVFQKPVTRFIYE